jgi:hypothetical protein
VKAGKKRPLKEVIKDINKGITNGKI